MQTIGILILTHGGLGEELLKATRKISGELDCFQSLTLDWNESPEGARRHLGQALEHLDRGSGVLILTDMHGSTPFNVAMGFREANRIEVVTGVNMPMVVRLGCWAGQAMSVAELARWIRDKGRRSITCCEGPEKTPPPIERMTKRDLKDDDP